MTRTTRALHISAVALALMSMAGCPTERAPDSGTVAAAGERIQLFDGSSTEHWIMADGSPCAWDVAAGELRVKVGSGSIRTVELFNDFTLHVEFNVPDRPPEVKGQRRGNSGVYLQNRYEIQVLDSFGLEPADNLCGAIYGRKAPDVNAAKPAGQWQTYDIEFTAPRWDAAGAKTANARVTVRHNGVVIHDDVEIEGPTGSGKPESPTPGPILLQDHRDNAVRYRNLWIIAN